MFNIKKYDENQLCLRLLEVQDDQHLKVIDEVLYTQVEYGKNDNQMIDITKKEKAQITFSPDGNFFTVFNKQFNKLHFYENGDDISDLFAKLKDEANGKVD